jgi:hypothetical protein
VIEFILCLVGGLFTLSAVFVGYYLSEKSAERRSAAELEARRAFLLRALVDELAFIGEKPLPYEEGKGFYRDPIRLSIPAQILDATTLRYPTDTALVQALLTFQVAVARYNDLVQASTLIQSGGQLAPHGAPVLYETVMQRHQALLSARDQVLRQMPTPPAAKEQ